jgi:hypothetical protein
LSYLLVHVVSPVWGHHLKGLIYRRRRSGNLQSKPGKTDPFMRAESWLRQRKTARVDELGAASAKSMLVRCLHPS